MPYVFWELTTQRVLTMEFIEGIQINDLNTIKKNKINPYEVSNKLSDMYSKMIFIHGFVHSDPHPGNILVRKGEKESEIILLDHGLYAVSIPILKNLKCTLPEPKTIQKFQCLPDLGECCFPINSFYILLFKPTVMD